MKGWQKQFAIAALVMGVFEIVDGALHLMGSTWDMRRSFSVIEMLWFLNCIPIAIFIAPMRVVVLPFIGFYAMSFGAAWVFYGLGMGGEDFAAPPWFGAIVVAFGLYYSSLIYRLLVSSDKRQQK